MIKCFQILLFLIPIFGFAQKDTIAHLYTFGGANNDNAEDVEATLDGGYIVVGSTSSYSAGNTDVYLLKIDSLCGYEWSFALGGTNNDWGYSVKQTFDKGFIIAASSNSYGNGGYDAVLMKRDSSGKYQWTKSYGGNDWDFAYSVVQTHDSGYVFCGETYNNTQGLSDVYIVKTDALGDTIWTRTIGGSLEDKGNAVIETSDSNIVVAGLRNTLTDSTQAYVLKLDMNGVLLWDSIYGGVGYEEINGIIATSSGDFVATGILDSSNDKDYYLLKTDKDGIKLWEQGLGGVGDEGGYDIFELVNGNFFVTGYTKVYGGGGKDAHLISVTSGGFWGGQSSTFGGLQDEMCKSFTMGLDGSIKIAGYTNSFGNGLEDVMVISVDTIVTKQQFTIDTVPDIIPLKVLELEDEIHFLLFPNPATNYLQFKTTLKVTRLVFIDVYGRNIKEIAINSENRIAVDGITNGVFNVLFYDKNQLLGSQKVIINR